MLGHPDVKNTISYVASSLAAMMEAEVMILDDNERVISGTALPEKGYHLSKIYDHTITSKELVVVPDPGFNALCVGCDKYGDCNELIELAAPIMSGEQCIGIISVTCYQESQRHRILDRMEAYTDFLSQMSSLIASRAQEVKAEETIRVINAELSTIINNVDECIIALDNDNKVTFYNLFTEKMLSAEDQYLVGQPITKFCPAYPQELGNLLRGKQEMEIIAFHGTSQKVYMSAHQIKTDGMVTGTIITFEERSKVNRFVSSFIGNNAVLSTSDIVSVGAALEKVKQRTEKVSTTDSTVLIRGESGTGKEMFARTIHKRSARSKGPFIALNCAAIPDTLLESELFGYEAGAFTGAKKGGKPGYFELADTGTIFLDEIGDMPIYLQSKLLRVLQEKTVMRIGGEKEKRIDIRIIAATNKRLEKMVEDNSFREDLFYRLNVIPLNIPPLRERGEGDILALINFFMEKYGQHFGKPLCDLSPEAKDALLSYRWPGNVRELENAVEYMLNMETSPVITFESLPEYIRLDSQNGGGITGDTLRAQIAEKEREILSEALAQYGRSKKGKEAAAKALDIGIASLYRKIREHALD